MLLFWQDIGRNFHHIYVYSSLRCGALELTIFCLYGGAAVRTDTFSIVEVVKLKLHTGQFPWTKLRCSHHRNRTKPTMGAKVSSTSNTRNDLTNHPKPIAPRSQAMAIRVSQQPMPEKFSLNCLKPFESTRFPLAL